MKSSQSRAAPKARSPRAATFVSRSRNAGSPSASESAAVSGMSRNLGPRFGGSTMTPVRGSTGPGEDRPMPAITAATSVGAPARASLAASMQPATTAAGPSSLGVGRSILASRAPSGRTTAARIRVPPRSTAMTGREDRAKPLDSIWEFAAIVAGALGPSQTSGKPRPPPVTRRGSKVLDEEGLAADLEHLGPALGTGAGKRLLAVLHRDLHWVHDFDFHLVLDAVGHRHGCQ